MEMQLEKKQEALILYYLKREDKKAETLAHDLEGVIKDHQGLFASDEVTLGAIAKIIEKRMEKNND